MRSWALLSAAVGAAGHGAVVIPPPRQAVDRDLAPWNGPVPAVIPGVDAWCPVPWNGNLSGHNGQACFWFSNGCTIGCDVCDGSTRGPIPDRPPMNRKMPACNKTVEATLCDRELRTVNVDVECGAWNDWYYYSPWRAPGSAPVFDSCGMAGGTPLAGGYGAVYRNTSHAVQGDLGSKKLQPLRSGTVWQAGGSYEVSWTVQANHGGGYQYRLCPASGRVSEECFQRNPLGFVGNTSFIQYGSDPATRVGIPAVRAVVSGREWTRNPIPGCKGSVNPQGLCLHNLLGAGGACCPSSCGVCVEGSRVCAASSACCPEKFTRMCMNASDTACLVPATPAPASPGDSDCWGASPMFPPPLPGAAGSGHPALCARPFNWSIVDLVRVPDDLPAGDYVVSWRWDCEETPQVWQACGDVSVVAASARESETGAVAADASACTEFSSPKRCPKGQECAMGALMTQGNLTARCCPEGWTSCGNPFSSPARYPLCDGAEYGRAFPVGVCCPSTAQCPDEVVSACPLGCSCV
eukprot:TRINITY_DN269_c2_g1_i1.p1 TRINITY_DN269_c2_g1~~TRINITY_DN269_c2_g1_i1.p1  ORF type:complete len:539 (+),score=158.47 TRINITY_DN269_c2_g1_i1:54-1619(+)